MIWIVIAIVVVLLLAAVYFYNRLVTLRNRVDNSWAQIDVQLKRRYDLIPNLVETVKGYAAHERETFEAVTNARTRAQAAQGPGEQAQAEGILGQALGRLFAVAEDYPELQADENFRQLQDELATDGEPDRRLAPGLQRHRPHVQQRDPDRAGRPVRRPVRLHEAGVLRGRGSSPGGTTRHVLAVAALAAAALVLAGQASAQSFELPRAAVAIQVQPDGSLVVDENITFAFSGSFTGAFRDIPLRDGESIDDVLVLEGGRPLPARRVGRAGLVRRPRHVRHDRHRQRAPHRLALPGLLGGRARSTSITGCAASRSPTTTSST